MQHQKPYCFSAFFWTSDGVTNGKPNVEPYRKKRTFTILGCGESTRSKKSVIKTRDCWDNAAVTRFQMEDPSPDLKDISDSGSCYYFWDCMSYSIVLAFCDGLEDEYDFGDPRVDNFIASLPLPNWERYAGVNNNYTLDYFKLLIDAFPDLQIKKVDIGF